MLSLVSPLAYRFEDTLFNFALIIDTIILLIDEVKSLVNTMNTLFLTYSSQRSIQSFNQQTQTI